MPTRTKPRQTRTKPRPAGRLARRPAAPPQGRFGRPGAPGRRPAPHVSRFTTGRRKPQQSSAKKALSAVMGVFGGASAKRSRRARGRKRAGSGGAGSKRTGGVALLAGGLGLAMKNRNKLGGMFGKRRAHSEPVAPPTSPPTSPPAATP